MTQTDDFEKRKNILDLEYQTYLNYINVIAAAFAAITFAIFSGLLMGLIIFFALFISALSRLDNIKEQIKNL